MAYTILLATLMLLSFKETSFWHNTGLLSGRALTINNKNPTAYYLVGNIHMEYKSFDHAERFYRKSLEVYPEFLDARINLSILLEETGRLDEAEVLLLETRQLYPKDPSIFYSLARVAQAQGNEEKTNRYYIQHANVLWQQGDLEAALKVYDTILQQAPNKVMAYHNKASALFFHKRTEEALLMVQEALRLDPAYEPSLQLLAAIKAEQGTQQ